MAAVALLAFLAFMHIVLAVTGVTGFPQVLVSEYALVTRGALDTIVLAPQGKSALLKMIEPGSSPAISRVTFLTLGTEFSFVALPVIVLAMTRVTLARGLLIVLGGVTGRAFCFSMLADKWKPGFAVIKSGLLPISGHVTIVAHLSEASFVLVVFAMASITIGRRGTKCLPTRMAIDALDFRADMRTGERKIRPLVIKGFLVQHHNLRLSSFMLGMTITARVIFYAPVIPCFTPDVFSNLFVIMTTQTKLVLSSPLECLVTGLAFVLKLGMALDQVTRGNHGIERTHIRS